MSTLLAPFREFLRKGDVILLLLCLTASGYGLALLYSATRWNSNNKAVIIQAVAVALGVVAYFLLTFVDFRLFTEKRWKLMLGGSILLLLLILTPLGHEVYGNRNWLQIPHFPVNLQPDEIDKIAIILILALLFSWLQENGHDVSSIPSISLTGGYIVFMMGLVAVICGDMGMCVIYMAIFVVMAWVSGVKLRWFILVGGAIAAAAVILWLFVLPETSLWNSVRIMRFRVLFDHDLDPLGRGFQQTRSILAIGSGRMWGQGYLNGTQTQTTYSSALPERSTDFIFAVCGEELGLVGCLLLILILVLIVLRCVWVGRHASSPFSAYVCMGMAGMLVAQIAFNIGMCLYVLPVMGLTLPFISYGGSSVITMYASMGIVSSVKAQTLPSWLRDRSNI